LFTVNMPVGSGGNPSRDDRAVLKVMPWLLVIIIESMYHGGGVLLAVDWLDELLPDVGV
jgi:hypothetical protein